MKQPAFTEADIRARTTPQVFERGQDYCRNSMVASLVRRGAELQAAVQGSQYTPCRVRIRLAEGTVEEARCDCPYDWGGWCKHIVAVLLAVVHMPERVEERPRLENRLDALDRAALLDLLMDLAARHPHLVEEIESRVALNEMEATPEAEAPAVDVRPFRRRVQAALHSLDHLRPSEAYWQVTSVVDQLREVIAEIETIVHCGQGRKALALLEAVTDEYVDGWMLLDSSSGESYEVFFDLAPVWTEALLTADFPAEERRPWARKLEAWQRELSLYGLEEVFPVAEAAAARGWDEPPARKGHWQQELVTVKLDIMERREQFEEFLHLAKAKDRWGRYAAMLVRLGRMEEAVRIGREEVQAAGDAHLLARALYEAGAAEDALKVAERGVERGGYAAYDLAVWLRDHAEEAGEAERALQAAVAVFEQRPTLDAYLKAESLAGPRWAEARGRLFDHLRKYVANVSPNDAAEVFLHAGLIDEAVADVSHRESSYDYETRRRVAEAAVETHPEWVVDRARPCRGHHGCGAVERLPARRSLARPGARRLPRRRARDGVADLPRRPDRASRTQIQAPPHAGSALGCGTGRTHLPKISPLEGGQRCGT